MSKTFHVEEYYDSVIIYEIQATSKQEAIENYSQRGKIIEENVYNAEVGDVKEIKGDTTNEL